MKITIFAVALILVAAFAEETKSLNRDKRDAVAGCNYNCTDVSWCNSTITTYAQCQNDQYVMTSCPCRCKLVKEVSCLDNANWCSSFVRAASDCTQSVNGTCCQSCSRYKASSCVDRVNWCGSYVSSCASDNNVASQCCLTCSRVSNAVNSCSDRSSWCSSYVSANPDSCSKDSNVKSQCCQTCSNKAAACSDASWCSSYLTSSSFCYTPSVAQSCCRSCAARVAANAACKYGDKYTWCNPSYCKTNRNDCCASCP